MGAQTVFWVVVLGAVGCADPDAPSPDAAGAAAHLERQPTALDDYVAAPDPAYGWEAVATLPGEGVVAHVLELTSQSWLEADEVDRTVWKHWLTLFVPTNLDETTGFLYITGGSNDDPPPSELDSRFGAMAVATGSVVAELRMVPNQSLFLTGPPPRSVGRMPSSPTVGTSICAVAETSGWHVCQ